MSVKRIILYTGQIDALDLFTMDLCKGFQALNVDCFIYNNQQPDISGLSTFCQTKVDAVISFNTMFYNLLVNNNQNAWHTLGIPFITILVDHPINFYMTLEKLNAKDKVFCIDREHVEYVKRFFPKIGYVGFLPHGGSFSPSNTNIPFEDRSIDILYAGSIRPYNPNLSITHGLIQKYQGLLDIPSVIKDLYCSAINDYNSTLESVIETYMTNYLGELDNDTIHMFFSDFHFLHEAVLAYHRARVLEAAADSGAEFHIYGSDYSGYEFVKKKNVHLHEFIAPKQVLDLMQNSKIVLSTMAWFKDGFHERIPNGMLAKALVLTEETRYINEVFCCKPDSEKQELYTFSLGDLGKVSSLISDFLSNPDRSALIAENGFKTAANMHTWEHRAKELFELL